MVNVSIFFTLQFLYIPKLNFTFLEAENFDRTGKTNEGKNTEKIEENVFESYSSRSSSTSGYGFPLNHDVNVEIPRPQTGPKIPLLNLNAKTVLKGGSSMNEVKEEIKPKPIVPGLGLNLENIKKKDFQDEFMERFDEYSKSWRDMIEQQKRF